MNLEMNRVDVWAAEIDDQPGGLARLLRAVADYGADLDCVIARRHPGTAGKGVVFVSPLNSREAVERADQVGLKRVIDTPTLRVEGPNEPAIGSKITKVIADAAVNLHGLSAMAQGHRFVCYIGFDSVSDLAKAEAALKSIATHDWRFWRRSETSTEAAAERR